MESLEKVIMTYFYECMYFSNYNKTLCASVMGTSVKTVHSYCERYGMSKEFQENGKFSDFILPLSQSSKVCSSPRLNNVSTELKDHQVRYDTIPWDRIKYFATNEERLNHADSMINRDWL